MYFDRNGRPIPFWEWAVLFETRNGDHIVQQTTVGHYRVSTVWVGLDMSLRGDPPLIFESMVFADADFTEPRGPGLPEVDGYYRRYATEEAALAGHDQIVAQLQAEELSLEDIMKEDTSESDSD